MGIEFFQNNTPMDPEDKKKILEYFKKGQHAGYAFIPSVDMVTGEEIYELCDDLIADGIYSWNRTLPYHFEKYDIPLKQEFIDYVLDRQNEKKN